MLHIENKTFGEERALYGTVGAVLDNCKFEGTEDGESALKESKNITCNNCFFYLRYPLWHTKKFTLDNCFMDVTCRAPMWYTAGGKISGSKIFGVKALRESKNVKIENSEINSPEFGWKCGGIKINDTKITSEYAFSGSKNILAQNLRFCGKYSFQYVKGAVIENCVLDTKDAFWHGRNITVKNCTVKGEYLGWYSENLTFINCKISGTQPLCYCKNLTLINCTMENTDLCFEYSDVTAEITGHIDSVKNPKSGKITAESIGEIILENSVIKTDCIIETEK